MNIKFKVGMKVSLGQIGEVSSRLVQLTKWSNDGFSYHNLVSGMDGWISDIMLRQCGELVG